MLLSRELNCIIVEKQNKQKQKGPHLVSEVFSVRGQRNSDSPEVGAGISRPLFRHRDPKERGQALPVINGRTEA